MSAGVPSRRPAKGLALWEPRTSRCDVQPVAAGEAFAEKGDERLHEVGGALLPKHYDFRHRQGRPHLGRAQDLHALL
jgi:hypothetical protein